MKNKCQKRIILETNGEYANDLLLPMFFIVTHVLFYCYPCFLLLPMFFIVTHVFLFGAVWHLATGHTNKTK